MFVLGSAPAVSAARAASVQSIAARVLFAVKLRGLFERGDSGARCLSHLCTHSRRGGAGRKDDALPGVLAPRGFRYERRGIERGKPILPEVRKPARPSSELPLALNETLEPFPPWKPPELLTGNEQPGYAHALSPGNRRAGPWKAIRGPVNPLLPRFYGRDVVNALSAAADTCARCRTRTHRRFCSRMRHASARCCFMENAAPWIWSKRIFCWPAMHPGNFSARAIQLRGCSNSIRKLIDYGATLRLAREDGGLWVETQTSSVRAMKIKSCQCVAELLNVQNDFYFENTDLYVPPSLTNFIRRIPF